MAKNRTSAFGATDGLLFGTDAAAYEEPKQQEKKNVSFPEARELRKTDNFPENDTEKIEYGTTQGKKGMKMKRFNMAFSDENYCYITKESRMNGMSTTAFVNKMIDEYRKQNGDRWN